MITGSLQIKKDYYYAVLNLKENGKRKVKWIATGLPVRGNKRNADAMLHNFIDEYSKLDSAGVCVSSDVLFADYVKCWLDEQRHNLATATINSYSTIINGRIDKWFRPLGVTLRNISASQIEAFYRSILDDNCTANTVIRHHAIIRKCLQSAMKKDLILKNPADKVDRPKKNSYTASHYSKEEMLTLFVAIQGDPLELPVTIAAYYGLRRSEVLGMRWSAINFEKKTVAVNHKVIEANVDGKFVPVGEDVLKTKSSHRTLPLIPAVEKALLEQKEKQNIYRRLFKKAYCSDFPDYVCTDELGCLLRPNYVTEHFTWLLKKYDLKHIRFHDLRHPYVKYTLKNNSTFFSEERRLKCAFLGYMPRITPRLVSISRRYLSHRLYPHSHLIRSKPVHHPHANGAKKRTGQSVYDTTAPNPSPVTHQPSLHQVQ